MGLLDRITGKTGKNIDLSVSAEPQELAPGADVVVRFDVAGELGDSCRAVVAYLKGLGTYRENEQYYEGTELKYREVERAVNLHEAEQEFPAQLGAGEATFTLPESAPPSSVGVVSWYAGVKVDIEKGSDKAERVRLSVRVPAERMSTEKSTQESEDGVAFVDVPAAVRAGETLTGTLRVAVKDDVTVTAVRMLLNCDATLGIGKDDRAGGTLAQMNRQLNPTFGTSARKESTEGNLELSGKRKFAAGRIEEFPFSLEIPADTAPSTRHERGHVMWRLEAVLDRRMRGDLTVEMPITIC